MKLLLSITLMLSLLSCRPEQEETDFNEMDISGISKNSDDLACTEIEDYNNCLEAPQCQPVYNGRGNDINDYQGCVGYSPEEDDQSAEDESQSAEDPASGDATGGPGNSGNGNNNADSGENLTDEQLLEMYGCGNGNSPNNPKKVNVCHFRGSGEAHTICIAIAGWERGHQWHAKEVNGEIREDYLGPCTESDAEGDLLTGDDLVDE